MILFTLLLNSLFICALQVLKEHQHYLKTLLSGMPSNYARLKPREYGSEEVSHDIKLPK